LANIEHCQAASQIKLNDKEQLIIDLEKKIKVEKEEKKFLLKKIIDLEKTNECLIIENMTKNTR